MSAAGNSKYLAEALAHLQTSPPATAAPQRPSYDDLLEIMREMKRLAQAIDEAAYAHLMKSGPRIPLIEAIQAYSDYTAKKVGGLL